MQKTVFQAKFRNMGPQFPWDGSRKKVLGPGDSYNAEIGKKRDLHGGPIFRNLAAYEGHSKSFETRYQGVKLGTSNLAES